MKIAFGALTRRAAIVLVASLWAVGCALDSGEGPGLTGPSSFALSVTATATPDRLPRDGASQSVITLKGGTYYGALSVAYGGDVKVFDSRSSDSIALVIHFKAPIIVGRDLLNSAGVVEEKSKPQDL